MSEVSTVIPSDSVSNVSPNESGSGAAGNGDCDAQSAVSTASSIYVTSEAVLQVSTQGSVDFYSSVINSLDEHGVAVSSGPPVALRQVVDAERRVAEEIEPPVAPDDYDTTLNELLVRPLLSRFAYSKFVSWQAGQPTDPQNLDPACTARNFCTMVSVPVLRDWLGGGRGLLPQAAISSMLDYVTASVPNQTATFVNAMTDWLSEVAQHLFDAHPRMFGLIVVTAAQANTIPGLTTVFDEDNNGIRSQVTISLWLLFAMLLDYGVICATPGLQYAIDALGSDDSDAAYGRMTNAVACAYLEGQNVMRMGGVFEMLPDECQDAQGEGSCSKGWKVHVARAPSEVKAVSRHDSLFFDLRTTADRVKEGIPIAAWRFGARIYFTLLEDEMNTAVHGTVSANGLATSTDVMTFAPDYAGLAANPSALSWRVKGGTFNAAFYIAANEADAILRLPYVQMPVATADTTAAWVKLWLWNDLAVQIEGIKQFAPHWEYDGRPALEFPRIRVYRTDWYSHEAVAREFWAMTLTHSPEEILVLSGEGLAWDDVSAAVCLLSDWPPSKPGNVHIRHVHSDREKKFANMVPMACAVEIGKSSTKPLIIVISNQLYGELPDLAGALANSGYGKVVDEAQWRRASRWPHTPPSQIRAKIRSAAIDHGYVSTCCYAREIAASMAYGPVYRKASNGGVCLQVPTVLSTDDFVFPRVSFRPPLARFFSTGVHGLSERSFPTLEKLTMMNNALHDHAVLGRVIGTRCGAQAAHLSMEWNEAYVPFSRGANLPRPEHKFVDAIRGVLRDIIVESEGYNEDSWSEYMEQVRRQLFLITGSTWSEAVSARVRVWSSPRGSSRRNVIELLNKGIVRTERINMRCEPSDILVIGRNMPVQWPMMLLGVDFRFGDYLREYIPAFQERQLELLTAPEGPHVSHALCRLDSTIPALRIMTTALEMRRIIRLEYPETRSEVPRPSKEVQLTVDLWKWEDEGGPPLAAVDTWRTWNAVSNTYYEFRGTVANDDRKARALRRKQFLIEVIVGMPSKLVPFVEPIRMPTFAYRRLRTRPMVTENADDQVNEVKRLRTEVEVRSRELEALKKQYEKDAKIGQLVQLQMAEAEKRMQTEPSSDATAEAAIKANEALAESNRQDTAPPTSDVVNRGNQAPAAGLATADLAAWMQQLQPAQMAAIKKAMEEGKIDGGSASTSKDFP